MKKIILLLFAFIAVSQFIQAQAYKTVTATEADQNDGAETDYIYLPNVDWFYSVKDLDIQTLCTQTGGTSDGKITIERSVDKISWKPVLTTIDTDLIAANDTFTIVNAGVSQFRLKTYWPYYRLKIVGTSGDSTALLTRYNWK